MKRRLRPVCAAVFLILCAAVAMFLHGFMESEGALRMIVQWQSGVQIDANGTERPYEQLEGVGPPPETDGGTSYRFSAVLPEELDAGQLTFETSGMDMTLLLNGTEIYRSTLPGMGEAIRALASIPLPENAGGQSVVVTCRPLDENAMFPPLLRIIDDSLTEVETTAYANRTGIPAGALSLAFLLVCGLFLLGFSRGKTDWSLLPLALAAALLVVTGLSESYGFYFLPEWFRPFATWPGLQLVILLALLVYLLLNRRRSFWRQLGLASLWSGGFLLVAYLISLLRGSYLSGYLNVEVTSLFQSGYYSGLAYWLSGWLATVCALISANGLARSIVQAQAEAQAMALKETLAMDSYRLIERKMRDSAALRHEMGHHIAALDILYRQGDMKGLGELLEKLRNDQAGLTQTQFTENFTVNAILQHAAAQAAEAGVKFEACALVPKDLPIPEGDLCVLLMNLLDNALEACRAVPDSSARFIRFRAEVKNAFLAIRCENSFSGELKFNERGELMTRKAEPESHGFGLKQMSAIAEKYHSLLDVSFADGVFTAQTALQFPKTA